jgi:hypothetical protein
MPLEESIMKYCTQCGKSLQDGEEHVCGGDTVSPALPETAAASAGTASGLNLDVNVLKGLLLNPQTGMRLHPGKDFIYGILGIAASVIGFFLWGLALQKKVEDSLNSVFGGFNLFGGFNRSLNLGKYFFGIGLVSVLCLIGALWLIGQWKGSVKRNWREVVTCLGSMQLLWGAGFIIAAVLVFISYQLSFLLMSILLLSALILTVLAAQDLFRMKAEQRFYTVCASITVYVLLTGIINALLM